MWQRATIRQSERRAPPKLFGAPQNTGLPDTVRRLQRSIGNQAVRALLARRTALLPLRTPPIQRVSDDEVRDAFETARMYQPKMAEVTDEVVKAITEAVTRFEQAAETNPNRHARYEKSLNWLIWKTDQLRQQWKTPEQDHFFTDISFWKKELEDRFAELTTPPGASDAELQAEVESQLEKDKVPMPQRILAECTMAQGVTGDLRKYILFSDQFSTCTPVIMFNASTFVGGLFHYAAGGKAQLPELESMDSAINPTIVWLDKKKRMDYDALTSFFEHRDVQLIQPSSQYTLFLNQSDVASVESSPPTHGLMFNMTWRKSIPKGLEGSGLRMYFNEEAYGPGFAKKGI